MAALLLQTAGMKISHTADYRPQLELELQDGMTGTEEMCPSKLTGCYINYISQHSHTQKWDRVKLVHFSLAEP